MDQQNKRATIYLSPHLHKALKLKAAESDRSISDLVNEAVKRSIREDAIDLSAIRSRHKEPRRSLEEFIQEMSKSGLL
ncbi:MAG: CopG family transcriptional regulator [Pseudomonadota bacterium]